VATFVLVAGFVFVATAAPAQQTPVLQQQSNSGLAAPLSTEGNLSNALGTTSDSDFWRQIRGGIQGQVTIPDQGAGFMVRSNGEDWRNVRNGPLSRYGWWALAGMVALLALFFAYRGRIGVDDGLSGMTMERFNGLERFAHWLVAGSFVILGLTGLNTLYGRHLFASASGAGGGEFGALHTAFASVAYYGKFVHNYVGFAFALGIVLIFLLWVGKNFPNKHDVVWLAKGGGMFVKGVHPPAGKFNAGQKILFWLVITTGVVLFLSGLTLMFPFVWFGMADMQLAQLIHSGVSIAMVAVVIAHIYIGSLGMVGAFDAMGTGQVDENWARQHHGVWVTEVQGEVVAGDGGAEQPAE
jgi:formate dehydrogenase subunit gamma